VLAHDARRAARVDAAGHTVPLDEQDRTLYDGARIAEAQRLLDRAMLARRSGPYQVQAAIACLHASGRPPPTATGARSPPSMPRSPSCPPPPSSSSTAPPRSAWPKARWPA
jgi:uncharacterized protein DUF6596